MAYAFHPRPRNLKVTPVRLRGGLGSGNRGLARLGDLTATVPQQQPLTPFQNTAIGAAPSRDPLSYVSPQAAIAAGVDPTATYAAWRKLLAEYPTPQVAVQAGIPSGVVQELWVQPPAPVPWAEQPGPFGIKKGIFAALAIGAAVLLGSRAGREAVV